MINIGLVVIRIKKREKHMRFTTSATMLILLLSLVACSSTPVVSRYPVTLERNMQAVHHWEVLAQQVVATQVSPIATTYNPAYGSSTSNPIYVDNSDQTEFGKGFYSYIMTGLLEHGIQPASGPDGAAVVKWGTQLVWHDKKGSNFPGVFAGAVGVISTVLFGPPTTPNSKIEVIVTTQVEREKMILSRQSHNFYINEENKLNFREPEEVAGRVKPTMFIP